jgi:hypothetical protein
MICKYVTLFFYKLLNYKLWSVHADAELSQLMEHSPPLSCCEHSE